MGSALLSSCGVAPELKPSLGGYGRDEYGHRPGPQEFRTVILDAGHGGKDSGAISQHTGMKEKDLTLDTVKRIRAELGNEFNVVLMRNGDYFIDLDERVARTNQYANAILVSIHYNSSRSPSTRGVETYYWRVDSHGLATRSQRAMTSVAGESNSRGLVRRRIRLTRNPQIPCLLLELGYLSHAQESRLVASPEYRQKLARGIAGAIRQQAQIGDAGTGPLPRPINAPPSRPTDAPE